MRQDRPVGAHLRIAVVCSLLLSVASGDACAAAHSPPLATGLSLETVASGLDQPLYVTAPPGDPRLFIVEQTGRIRIVRDGRLLARPFIDLTDRVRAGGERGLLSVAFHPQYARNGFFYVDYTDLHGDTHVERYSVTADPDRGDPSSAHLLLKIDQPFANHNGGLVLFGPDGRLYIGMGDGGGSGDPLRNGQNLSSLLGKLLRIDVDGRDPYSVPPDNPFAGRAGARPEIWAYGLRNPWRFGFDRATGTLLIADVGQDRWEEIDASPAAGPGLNYGWNLMEADHCFGARDCDSRGLIRPVVEYGHDQGCSITGGLVYRGRRMPSLTGHYFYADFCAGWIRSFRLVGGAVTEHRQWRGVEVKGPTSFGEDAAGELYVCSQRGAVYRLVMARP
jgi:hypothetical protein